jgi:hypothetical protein
MVQLAGADGKERPARPQIYIRELQVGDRAPVPRDFIFELLTEGGI